MDVKPRDLPSSMRIPVMILVVPELIAHGFLVTTGAWADHPTCSILPVKLPEGMQHYSSKSR